jgi:hypothetical protein
VEQWMRGFERGERIRRAERVRGSVSKQERHLPPLTHSRNQRVESERLCSIDLQGGVMPVWKTRGGRLTWGIPLAMVNRWPSREAASQRNIWVIESF